MTNKNRDNFSADILQVRFSQSIEFKKMQEQREIVNKSISQVFNTYRRTSEFMKPVTQALQGIPKVVGGGMSQAINDSGLKIALDNINKIKQPLLFEDVFKMSSIVEKQLFEINKNNEKIIGTFIDSIETNQKLFNSFSDLACCIDKDLTDEEQRAFEVLDNIKTEDDIKAINKFIEDNKESERPAYYLLIYVFQILLLLIMMTSSSTESLKSNALSEGKNTLESKSSIDFLTPEHIIELVNNGIYDLIKLGIVKVCCYIRKKPDSKSEKLLKINKYEEVYIIDDVNYYYKIIYHNEKGECSTGYIAKRNVKTLKEVE